MFEVSFGSAYVKMDMKLILVGVGVSLACYIYRSLIRRSLKIISIKTSENVTILADVW